MQALAFNACKGLKLIGVTSDDSPRNHISISESNGAVISNININAPANSPNTDGIDISNTNGVQINGGNIGTGMYAVLLKKYYVKDYIYVLLL